MKTKTLLADLLDPNFSSHLAIGELARTLQAFLATAQPFRNNQGNQSSGPTETLANYSGCVNSSTQHWHSNRMNSGSTTTWLQNRDCLRDCLLASLCDRDAAALRWRTASQIHLAMPLPFGPSYQAEAEQAAWLKLMALHRHQLPHPTFNPSHPRVNLLAAPELEVHPDGVYITCSLTQKSELRQDPRCYSRWTPTAWPKSIPPNGINAAKASPTSSAAPSSSTRHSNPTCAIPPHELPR